MATDGQPDGKTILVIGGVGYIRTHMFMALRDGGGIGHVSKSARR